MLLYEPTTPPGIERDPLLAEDELKAYPFAAFCYSFLTILLAFLRELTRATLWVGTSGALYRRQGYRFRGVRNLRGPDVVRRGHAAPTI